MSRRAPSDDAAIRTTGLTKRYGAVTALDHLTLAVPRGIIYGFLGPNGAGKTTTIRLLMGFIRPTAGSASIFGYDTWWQGVDARREVGYLVPSDALYPEMSGEAQLDFAARLSGREPRLRRWLLDALDLSEEALKRRLGSYSRGMRQKLALVAALQHDPELLILDEPTEGLDPLVQRAFEDVIRTLRARGRTIFMSSHNLAEVERTCERVAVVRRGQLVVEGTVEGLQRLHRRQAEIAFRDGIPEGLARVPGVTIVERQGGHVRLILEGDVNPLLGFLAQHRVEDVVLRPPDLDDIFMSFYVAGEPGPNGSRAGLEARDVTGAEAVPSQPGGRKVQE
jgi:ABC-2 type transport system ATP-binding protein